MTPADILARLSSHRSDVVQAGIAKPAAVLVPLREERRGELSLVFTRRAEDLPHHPGQVSFPGGGIAATDPTPEAAALREAQEEISLAPEQVRLIGRLDEIRTFNDFHITPVVGVVDPAAILQPRAEEVARIFSIPMRVLLDPKQWVQKEHVHGESRFVLWHVYYDAEDLWGLTGQMVRGMVETLWR